MVRNILESLMREKREIYLREHPTKANGYYTRDLLTLTSPLENLRVPRVREGDFKPEDPVLSEARLVGTFRGHPHPVRRRGEHQEHFPLSGRRLRRFLLPAKRLPSPRGRRGTGETLGKGP
ncbi:MAG: transposase [Methanomassiliicoccales archaeon]|nr:transposase [Methanomassiliicoccales archaeon]